MKSRNPIIDIIRTAHTHKWCIMPYCTTCGAKDYRQALKQLEEVSGESLANILADVNPSEIVREHGWQDALLVAVIDLPLSFQLEGVVRAWLPKFCEDVGFSDFILYKVIPRLPRKSITRKEWIAKSIALAKDNKNFSLIESLVLVLKETCFEHPELIEIAKEHAKSSSQMRRVLRNSCGIAD